MEEKCSYGFGFIKPHAIVKSMEVFQFFTRAGFAFVYHRRLVLSALQAERHYAKDDAWKMMVGRRSLQSLGHLGRDISDEMALERGQVIWRGMVDDITLKPVKVFVVSLPVSKGDAIALGREIIGHTNPAEAAKGTIRCEIATFGESYELADKENRPLRNVVHYCDSEAALLSEILNIVPAPDLCDFNLQKRVAAYAPVSHQP